MFVTVLLAASLTAPVPKAKPAELYFPTVEGTKLVTRMTFGEETSESTGTITKVVEKDGVYTVTSSRDVGGRESNLVYEVSGKGVFLVSSNGQEKAELRPVIKLPAKEGDTWTTEQPKPGGGVITITYIVGKVEEVTVPAGTFKAITVALETNLGGRVTKANSWYAPGVGLVKRVTEGEVERVQELKEVIPGKAK